MYGFTKFAVDGFNVPIEYFDHYDDARIYANRYKGIRNNADSKVWPVFIKAYSHPSWVVVETLT